MRRAVAALLLLLGLFAAAGASAEDVTELAFRPRPGA